jgi:hypothetical protein
MVRIYLSGGIKKDEDDRKICWSEEDKEAIRSLVEGVEFLDPQRTPEVHDSIASFGCDLNDVKCADIVLVDARQKRGIGIGAEMAVAKMLGKPVVSVVPRNSHYRRDVLNHFGKEIRDWTHPFLVGLSDSVVESVGEAATWVSDFLKDPGPVKDASVVEEAIAYFLKKEGK